MLSDEITTHFPHPPLRIYPATDFHGNDDGFSHDDGLSSSARHDRFAQRFGRLVRLAAAATHCAARVALFADLSVAMLVDPNAADAQPGGISDNDEVLAYASVALLDDDDDDDEAGEGGEGSSSSSKKRQQQQQQKKKMKKKRRQQQRRLLRQRLRLRRQRGRRTVAGVARDVEEVYGAGASQLLAPPELVAACASLRS